MDDLSIVEYLIMHEDEILKDIQWRHCISCQAPTPSMVYRSPACYELGKMLKDRRS